MSILNGLGGSWRPVNLLFHKGYFHFISKHLIINLSVKSYIARASLYANILFYPLFLTKKKFIKTNEPYEG